ncbi:7273_t:CDS:2, partial [Scutellospora calospora]
LEVQLKLKELYEQFNETSPQIRPKDPYSAFKSQPKAIALLEQINAEKMKKS